MDGYEDSLIDIIQTEIIESDIEIHHEKINQLRNIFDPQVAQNSLAYIFPIQKLALYLIERLYYLPEVIKLLELRTRVVTLLDNFNQNTVFSITEQEMEEMIDIALDQIFKGTIIPIKFSKLISDISIFLHLFLQLADPSRRFSEFSYLFMYKYSTKIETLLKMDDRVNYVITKIINGTRYIQLVYDTDRSEDLLNKLPYQFLQPEICIIITSDVKVSVNVDDFNPDFLLCIGNEYDLFEIDQNGYFLEYNQSYFPISDVTPDVERYNVYKI